MTIKQSTAAERTYEQAVAAQAAAADALYSAEVALREAQQTQVDRWIAAAQASLHLAVTRYAAAAAQVSCLRDHPLAA